MCPRHFRIRPRDTLPHPSTIPLNAWAVNIVWVPLANQFDGEYQSKWYRRSTLFAPKCHRLSAERSHLFAVSLMPRGGRRHRSDRTRCQYIVHDSNNTHNTTEQEKSMSVYLWCPASYDLRLLVETCAHTIFIHPPTTAFNSHRLRLIARPIE